MYGAVNRFMEYTARWGASRATSSRLPSAVCGYSFNVFHLRPMANIGEIALVDINRLTDSAFHLTKPSKQLAWGHHPHFLVHNQPVPRELILITPPPPFPPPRPSYSPPHAKTLPSIITPYTTAKNDPTLIPNILSPNNRGCSSKRVNRYGHFGTSSCIYLPLLALVRSSTTRRLVASRDVGPWPKEHYCLKTKKETRVQKRDKPSL